MTGIAPAAPGLTARVVEGDDQLSLTNDTRKTLIVLGYENEPYLRIHPEGGVDVNSLSPASTLNINRYGHVTLPPSADPNAPPQWKRIRSGRTYTWHDHRIHWMSTIDPPAVRRARGSQHHIFDWAVPVRVDGDSAAVRGTLDYYPAARGAAWIWLGAAGVATLGGLAILYRVVRRSRRAARP